MVRTRQLILWSALLLFVLGVAALLMYFWGGTALLVVTELTASVGVIVFIIIVVLLFMYYLGRAEVREKHRLMRVFNKINKELAGAQEDLADALQKENSIRDQLQEERADMQKKHEQLIGKIEGKIKQLKIEHQQELVESLKQLQNAHLESGLKAEALDPADVPGIGEVLVEKLAAREIRTAFDVTEEALSELPGFGESKILSLVRWRDSVENNLRKNMLVELPEENRIAIAEKYDQQLVALEEEKQAARLAFEKTVEELQSKEASELAEAIAKETSSRQMMSTLEAKKHDQHNQIQQYTDITFKKMLLTALAGASHSWQQRALSYLLLFLFIVFGILHAVILVSALIASRL
jgi:DNA-binding helix-hairpin-helix protein with protein kinase domain